MSKLKAIIIFLFFIIPLPLYSAGPITHVALGQKWLSYEAPNYTDEQKKLFLLGTVFPDIRYLGVIKREQTHYKGVTLSAIRKTSSPFQQGVLFHSFVDEFREKWVKEHKTEAKLTDVAVNQKHTFLKIIEDQINYSEQSWGSFRQYLMSIPADEKQYGIDDKALSEWHAGLTLYFTASPMVLLTQFSLLEKDIFTIKASAVKQWATLLPEYVERTEMKQHVADMMLAFDKALSSI